MNASEAKNRAKIGYDATQVENLSTVMARIASCSRSGDSSMSIELKFGLSDSAIKSLEEELKFKVSQTARGISENYVVHVSWGRD